MPIYDWDNLPYPLVKELAKLRRYSSNIEDDINESATELTEETGGINELRIPYAEELKYTERIMSVRGFRVRLSSPAKRNPVELQAVANTVEGISINCAELSVHLFDVDQTTVNGEAYRDELKTALEVYHIKIRTPSKEADYTGQVSMAEHTDVFIDLGDYVDFVVNPVFKLIICNLVDNTESLLEDPSAWTITTYYKPSKVTLSAIEALYNVLRQEA